MGIDRNCWGTIAGLWAGTAALCALLVLVINVEWISVALVTLAVIFMGFVTWFHRVPIRKAVGDSRTVSSVADGKVVIVRKTFEKEYLRKECIQVSVYMDFFDVHANFWPLTGTISYYQYHPGRYFLAFLPKASEDNEHSSTSIRNADGKEVFFRQIAGTFARRIVCYSAKGLKVKAGEQCGIIKFGSRIDFFLPLDAEILVKVGDKTRACETVIAKL